MSDTQRASDNAMGLAGFIVSLVGLVSCGVLSPIGAILSLIGLFRDPKGFAIAGLVLGLVGSLWVLVIGAIVAAAGAIAVFAFFKLGFNFGVVQDVIAIQREVGSHYEATGAVPATLDGLSLSEPDRTDPWGTGYRYTPDADGLGYELHSAGRDGLFDSDDDLHIRIDADGDLRLDDQ